MFDAYHSYRSWLEKIRKENPAFLTIISLELPESPIPLIDYQANYARSKHNNSDEVTNNKDDILDKFLEKFTEVNKKSDGEKCSAGRNNLSRRKRRSSGRKNDESSEYTKSLATLDECTRNTIEGQ